MYQIVILIGLILIITNYKKVFREDNSFAHEMSIQEQNEVNTKLIHLRKEIGESFIQEQQEIEELKNKLIKVDEEIKYIRNEIQDIRLKETYPMNKENIRNNSDNERVEKIRMLLKENMTIEEICEKTGVGKGEILLIKELFPQ